MNLDHYTFRVVWSPEDGEHVGLCDEFPSLSWASGCEERALAGIKQLVTATIADMQASGEKTPKPAED